MRAKGWPREGNYSSFLDFGRIAAPYPDVVRPQPPPTAAQDSAQNAVPDICQARERALQSSRDGSPQLSICAATPIHPGISARVEAYSQQSSPYGPLVITIDNKKSSRTPHAARKR